MCEVVGWGNEALAEYAAVVQDQLVPKPSAIGFEQAAALPVSGFAALQAVSDHGEVGSGDRVLVIGASGGVGSFAVQIAKALGAEVTGVASTRNLDLVRSLGADHVIDYTQEDYTESGEIYDVAGYSDDVGGRIHVLDATLAARSQAGTNWINRYSGRPDVKPVNTQISIRRLRMASLNDTRRERSMALSAVMPPVVVHGQRRVIGKTLLLVDVRSQHLVAQKPNLHRREPGKSLQRSALIEVPVTDGSV